MKVRVIKKYTDLQKNLVFDVGEEHEVTKSRAQELEEKGLVEVIKIGVADSNIKEMDTTCEVAEEEN